MVGWTMDGLMDIQWTENGWLMDEWIMDEYWMIWIHSFLVHGWVMAPTMADHVDVKQANKLLSIGSTG